MKYKVLGSIYRGLLRPILFRFDPEWAHDHFLKVGVFFSKHASLRFLTRISLAYRHPMLEQKLLGIHFPNPVGLSAGFDKDGHLTEIMPSLGFGFMQVGSITAKAYAGNPKPRLHRLVKSKGIVVYYGLKNDGVRAVVRRYLSKTKRGVVSFSVAKTNCKESVSTEGAIADYLESLKLLKASKCADFITINISCPNTYGGEPFTDAKKLAQLLGAIDELKLTEPLCLKMPINLPWDEFQKLLDVAVKYKVKAVAIGNLNKNHKDPKILDPIPPGMKGGISGKPTEDLSNALIAKTYASYGERLLIIGVGGIFTAEDAFRKIELGASLVQLITGMIFQGPQQIGHINKGLAKLLKAKGYTSIHEAVGSGIVTNV